MIQLILSLIMSVAVTLQPGDKAPMFSATATDGSKISLQDYIGKSNVVLYFYPEDMTSGCTIEACKFRDDHDKFQAVNTVVLGVSLDDQEKHKQFTQKENLNFPLLVDEGGKICEAYGVPVDQNWPKRWTYLIGKDGAIVKKYDKVNVREHSEELLKDIADYNQSHK